MKAVQNTNNIQNPSFFPTLFLPAPHEFAQNPLNFLTVIVGEISNLASGQFRLPHDLCPLTRWEDGEGGVDLGGCIPTIYKGKW